MPIQRHLAVILEMSPMFSRLPGRPAEAMAAENYDDKVLRKKSSDWT
jgi:hypothetical protein